MDRRLRFAGAVAGLVFAAAAAGEIYRWVDAQGQTHFGDSPPSGASARPLPVPPMPAPGAAAASRPGVVEQARRLAAEREQAESAQAALQERERRDTQARLRACAFTRQQLDTVQRGGPVTSLEHPGSYLPDSERDAEIARLQAEAARLCSGLRADDLAPQLQREEARGARAVECVRARDRLGLLESPGARAVASDLEAARAAVRRFCD